MAKRFVILGAGESGVGSAILAKKQGYEVFVSDAGSIKEKYKTLLQEHQIEFEEGEHTLEKILNATEVMKSPGISEKVGLVQVLRKKNIPIISEIEFTFRYIGNSKIVGITGSNGKTTTTNLVYTLLQNAGLNVGMAGNVGISFAQMVAENPKEIYVLEISSFQLDDIKNFKSNVAVLLNITPDHLDRYKYELKNYAASKFKIAQNQTAEDVFIYCADDPETMRYFDEFMKDIPSKKIPFSIEKQVEEGGWADNENIHIHYNQNQFSMLIQDLGIKGKHNQYNSLAAGIVGKTFGLRKETIRQTFEDFNSLEHRLESVLKINGVEYINDSKATNVNSTWFALESMEKPVVWIAGGVDKGNDYEVLKPLARKKVKALICLGVDNMKLHEAFSGVIDVIVNVQSMKEALHMASQLAVKNDAVLLSPACASFDLFQNYEDRGNQFKQGVREL